ncbi:Fungal Zn(2)-Cys(6) binuclear cluster domain [Rhizoctonia solani]|uniref:Fungal Zn(2)-Cys(6) binuclear cluster domain n=1 Tax=Rhizoctonia solani TaxID=456999 RepID=A0A8H8NXZ4_9AGAM|nr:Fungal Zn(2)-Cys(6) binuclear cluster domain [Rhizoctonia solani]QRW20087.1 Fungal Zn(2)-Cys(6) binuclear cluster domain [Rhizoctonia solani]
MAPASALEFTTVHDFKALDCLSAGLPEDRIDRTSTTTEGVTRSYIVDAGQPCTTSGHTLPARDNPSEDLVHLWSQSQSRSIVYSSSRTYQSDTTRCSFDTISGSKSSKNNPAKENVYVYRSIIPSVDGAQATRESYFALIANEYIYSVLSFRFMAPSPTIRTSVAGLNHDFRTHDTPLKKYLDWINEFERRFITNFGRSSRLEDVGDCLAAHIELAVLRFFLRDSASAYSLLSEQPNGNLTVSFPRVLGSPRYELSRFVLYDTILSFLLGVPPLLEYGYEGTCESDGFEWIHGIPFALFQIIAQVNSWRAGSKVPLDDWQTLEQRVLTWRPSHAMLNECSASEDANIERATAGIAARLERHRVAVYETLLSFTDARPWLLGGPRFSQFLYHLWHGAGEGGRAITWNDYVQSRHETNPL